MTPPFLYGTAWKELQTQRLTELALEAGYRGIDTANQRKHYFEEAVGQAVQSAIARGLVQRGELFLQTKFTFVRGQDQRLPYDPRARIADQVRQSFASSQKHLGTEVIDSYVLHGPSRANQLIDDDWEAWGAMEQLHTAGAARALGISNVSIDQLEALVASSKVKPAFVQNRCYANRGWDEEVRAFCRAHSMVYQGFSLLTANPQVLASTDVLAIAKRRGLTASQVVFAFALQVGMLPLTGTSDVSHMRADLQVVGQTLDEAELLAVTRAG